MNKANRQLWLTAQAAVFALERGLTHELHEEKPKSSKESLKLAVEWGGVAAAKAALETVG